MDGRAAGLADLQRSLHGRCPSKEWEEAGVDVDRACRAERGTGEEAVRRQCSAEQRREEKSSVVQSRAEQSSAKQSRA